MRFAAILLLAGLAGAAYGQGVPAPIAKQQYFSNSGAPLASGHVCTYLSGSSTAVATFTDYTLTVPNQLCVPLDAGGRANIWLDPAVVYRFVLKDAANVTIWTEDGISVAPAGGGGSGQTWAISGTTIYNPTAGTKVCIGATPCTAALALLNVNGASSGTNYLIRIDDSANAPGINLYGSGNSLGTIGADSSGVRVRDGSGNSQLVIGTGAVTVENAGAGATNFTVKAGFSQGSQNLLDIKSNGGVSLAYIDSNGRYLGTLYNAAPATGTDIAYQTANSNFSVNGNGDISSNGGINATGADGNDPYKVNGTTIVDALGNATFTSLTCTGSPCGTGGGGGGSPGGATTQVQYNNAGLFGGSANFTWNNAGQLLTVNGSGAGSAAIAVGVGYIQSGTGFVAPTATLFNSIQAPLGGMLAKSFSATNYIQTGNSAGAPTPTTSDAFHPGALYYDTGSAGLQVYDGASWVSVGGGGGGTPGGATTNVQYNSAGSFAGSGNFTWDNAARLLTVTATNPSVPGIAVGNGYIQAAAGFLAPGATATSYNSIQAPGGGMAARSFTAVKYIQTGSGASDPTATTSDSFNPGALYYNTAAGAMKVYNGSAWVNLTGSGGGSPGGANTNVQFNNSGGFGGSSAFTWNSGSQLMTVTALSPGFPAIAAGIGYIQSDAGFLATAATAINYNSIQAPSGGVYARSLRATTYIQTGSTTGTPSPTPGDSFQAGALNFNSSLGTLQVFNGSSWVSIGSGGGSGVTSASGTGNQVLVNGTTSAQTGAVTFSLPQSIGTSSIPTFGGVIANGAFNSTASGSAISFQTSNTRIQMDGNGNISAFGEVNLTGGASNYKMNGGVVINNLSQFVGSGVKVTGGIEAVGYNVTGGLLGQNWNLNFPAAFTINGAGAFTSLIVRGGIIVSAFGIFGSTTGFLFMWLIGLMWVAARRILAKT